MPSIDKIVKMLLSQMNETKDVMKVSVQNQELMIQQNQQIISALMQIQAALESRQSSDSIEESPQD